MPSDYEAISDRNKRELGTNLKSRRTQISLYADPTHFVYELLQNADDHQATEISFRLEPERLIVEHNARIVFQEKHVKGISFFEESTSESDLLKTGKFGLGFKSVLTFTATPRIISDDECFEIFDLHQVRPFPKPNDYGSGTTRFDLPFNHHAVKPEFIFREHLKSASIACDTIESKFQSLENCVLLFTRYLRRINFISAKSTLSWSRINKRDSTIAINSPTYESRYRLYERPIEFESVSYPSLQLAIELDINGNPKASNIPLVVTFPTAISTGMGLVLNGPFRTTPAREMIGLTDEFNKMLLVEAADLVKELLRQEKRQKRLDCQLLELLPLDESRSDCPELFSALAQSVRDFVATEKLLPAESGGFVSGKQARIARGQFLMKLFSDKQLTEIEGSNEVVRWLLSDISEHATPNLYKALEAIVKGNSPPNNYGLTTEAVIRPERLFGRMSKEFLQSQSAKWFCELYCVLGEMAKKNAAREIAEGKPILRLSSNEQVLLKSQNGSPAAFLPGQSSSSFKTVSPTAIRKAAARSYLVELGFDMPGLSADVLEQIIPKYTKRSPSFQFSTHISHLKKCIAAIETGRDLPRINQGLCDATIIYAINAETGKSEFRKPSECYFPDDGLTKYFEGYSSAWFVSERYSDYPNLESEIHELFLRIGVNESRPREMNAHEIGDTVPIAAFRGWHIRGLRGFHPDWDVSGLQNALENPSIDRSAIVWNLFLSSWEHRIEGTVQKCSKQHFPSAETKTEEKISNAGKLLRDCAWIPNRNGEFLAVTDFESDSQLHPCLVPNIKLLAALNKGSQRVREAAKTLAIENISSEKLGELRVREDQRHEFEEYLESSAGATSRRRSKVGPRSTQSSRRTTGSRHRMVRLNKISSDEIFRYLEGFYLFESRWRCQVCRYPMPFKKRNKEDYCEKHELLSGSWAAKHGYTLSMPMEDEDEIVTLPEVPMLHIVVCPTCNRIFQEYVAAIDAEQERLLNWVLKEDSTQFQIRCSAINDDEQDRWIQFHRKHLDDIREVVSANLVQEEVVCAKSSIESSRNGKGQNA